MVLVVTSMNVSKMEELVQTAQLGITVRVLKIIEEMNVKFVSLPFYLDQVCICYR